MRHHANGEECNCDMEYSEHPRKYAKLHPNKEPNFNDEIAAAIRKSNETRLST